MTMDLCHVNKAEDISCENSPQRLIRKPSQRCHQHPVPNKLR